MSARLNVVVTGSTRGIGKGLAGEILKRGHNVVVSGRTTQAVDAAIAELAPTAANGARVTGAPCDVSKRDDLQGLWDAAVAAFGRVDIWINNAGISHPRQRAGDMHEQDINSVQEINLLGMMLATQIALHGMRPGRRHDLQHGRLRLERHGDARDGPLRRQ